MVQEEVLFFMTVSGEEKDCLGSNFIAKILLFCSARHRLILTLTWWAGLTRIKGDSLNYFFGDH